MNRIPMHLLLMICIAFIFACKKKEVTQPEENPEPTPITYPNYSQLKVGNYWIYDRYQVELNGSTTKISGQDSCYVEKDTIVRNQTYFKLRKYDFIYNVNRILVLRDSLHYIISSKGEIQFSSEDFSTVFSTNYVLATPGLDTLYKITRKMNDKDLVITVGAGTFTTSNMQTTYEFNLNQLVPVINPRYQNARYCKNIGLITESEPSYVSVAYSKERRLIRYHLN